jgi:putative addiction module component (TIGR02574 family)
MMMVADLLEQASLLDNEQQIELVEAIWNGIVKRGSTPDITPGQKAELDCRLADYLANPDAVDDWENVKARVLAKLKK